MDPLFLFLSGTSATGYIVLLSIHAQFSDLSYCNNRNWKGRIYSSSASICRCSLNRMCWNRWC